MDAASGIRHGTFSSVEYTQALLAHIDRIEPRIQAFVTIDRAAVLAEARQCDAEAAAKRFRGPLHGVPIGVKGELSDASRFCDTPSARAI